MHRRTIQIFSVIIIVFCILGCGKLFGEKFYTLGVFNNTSKLIRPYLGTNPAFPDTTLPIKKPGSVKVGSALKFDFTSQIPWSNIISELPADTLSIYLFDDNIFSSDDWADIRENYKILMRYDLSIEDLERLNWKVTYPPSENMKDIKQFPPY